MSQIKIHPRAMAALHRVALLPEQDRLRKALASGNLKEIYAHGIDLESPEYFTSERTVSGEGGSGCTYSGLWPVGLAAAEAVAALIVGREPDEDGDVHYWSPPVDYGPRGAPHR